MDPVNWTSLVPGHSYLNAISPFCLSRSIIFYVSGSLLSFSNPLCIPIAGEPSRSTFIFSLKSTHRFRIFNVLGWRTTGCHVSGSNRLIFYSESCYTTMFSTKVPSLGYAFICIAYVIQYYGFCHVIYCLPHTDLLPQSMIASSRFHLNGEEWGQRAKWKAVICLRIVCVKLHVHSKEKSQFSVVETPFPM